MYLISLNQLKTNLVEMFLGWFSANYLFLVLIENARLLPKFKHRTALNNRLKKILRKLKNDWFKTVLE